MIDGLYGRSFLKEVDFSESEWRSLLDLSIELKREKKQRRERQRLQGANIALLFEKTSTRTRCSFEVAAYDQGARVTYLDSVGSQMGHKESIEDTGRVLGRFYEGIEHRGDSQEQVEILSAAAGVPVWNGLSDLWHPTQTLADQLTMMEHLEKPLEEMKVAYLGDGRNNVANSFLVGNAMMGMDVRIGSPENLLPDKNVQAQASDAASRSGGSVLITSDPLEAVVGADVVYTDVWVSMGEPKDLWLPRIDELRPYQVNSQLMDATENPDAIFMHCLPAYHDLETEIGRYLYDRTGMTSLEVSDDVFHSAQSVVFDEAENRMHTIKAVMVATLARE